MTKRAEHSLRALLSIVTVPLLASGGPIALSQASQFQPAASPRDLPRFEVATIKPIDSRAGAMHQIGLGVYPSGRVVIPAISLKGLIGTAFDLPVSRLSGGEEWMEREQYDVVAKAPEDATQYDLRHTWFRIEDSRLRQMLQALLIDRFQLKFHLEIRTGQAVGAPWCLDDWCLQVESASRATDGPKVTYDIKLRIFSTARGITQRANGAWLYLIDERGHRYAANFDPSAVPLTVQLGPGQSGTTSRRFEVPGDAGALGLITGHGGPYCGAMSLLIIGEGGCLFNRPTLVRVN